MWYIAATDNRLQFTIHGYQRSPSQTVLILMESYYLTEPSFRYSNDTTRQSMVLKVFMEILLL